MLVCRRCRSIYGRAGRFCGIDGEPLTELETDPLIGQTIDRYSITDLIGRGGMGSVYKAIHRELDTEMAIKVLFGDLGSDPTFVARFRREAQVASKIRSPYVVSVVDFGTTQEGLTYLVMEYIHGVMLDEVASLEGTLEAKRAARVVADVARGLAVVHRMGFVHRDVKPANIALIQDAGREMAKLLDFGIVQVARTEESTKLTGADMIVGTPAYMSPEQAIGEEVTLKADLYSLGVVLYELISGHKPYAGNRSEVLEKLTSANSTPLPLGRGDSLADLTYRLMARDPKDRPASAEEVAEAADRIATQSQTVVTAIQPAPRSTRSTLFITLAAVTVGVAALAGTFLVGANSNAPSPAQVDTSQLELSLSAELRAHGLEAADLGEIPETRNAYTTWTKEKTRDLAAAKSALESLLTLAKEVRATKEIVSRKLERLDAPLAAHEATMSEEQKMALRAQYLELYKRLNSDPDMDALARDVAAFSMSVRRGTSAP
ncbi:MAG: serine/threonine protein kinase [Deltaproteobacteria bacterium]|nr:serine/threonine protein kinase [Deltaproteobacteria bacterium]